MRIRMSARRLAELTGVVLPPEAEAEVDRALSAGVAEAHQRWSGLPELGDDFLATIQGRIEGEPDLALAVGRLALPDLYLMTACLRGDRTALAAFERLGPHATTPADARLGGPKAEDDVPE